MMSPIFSVIDFKSGSLSHLLVVFLGMGHVVIKIQLNFHYLCTISWRSQKEGVLLVFIQLNINFCCLGSSFFTDSKKKVPSLFIQLNFHFLSLHNK